MNFVVMSATSHVEINGLEKQLRNINDKHVAVNADKSAMFYCLNPVDVHVVMIVSTSCLMSVFHPYYNAVLCRPCGCPCGNHCYNLLKRPTCCTLCVCFPDVAKVVLQNGEAVTMSGLRIGDQVQVVRSLL